MKLTNQQWDEITALYKARSHSLRDLQAKFGVNIETIRQHLLKRGVAMNPRYRVTLPNRAA